MVANTISWTAIIPLRKDSKGLPGKNTRLLVGKPLYRHAVDLALMAGASRVIISTDIPEILLASHPSRVETQVRPLELCGDDVPMAPVLTHAIQAGHVQGAVVLLQATSPLRSLSDVRQALSNLARGEFDLVMSVVQADSGALKWGHVDVDGLFSPLSSLEHCFSNRQSLPPIFKPNGAIFAMDAQWFLKNQGFFTQRLGTVLMSDLRSQDIDNLADFERCESILTSLAVGD